MVCFRALEAIRIAVPRSVMPTLPLTRALDQSSNLPKMASGTMDFVLCEDSRGVVYGVNPSLFTELISLRLEGFRLIPVSPYPALVYLNMSLLM